MTDCAYPNGPHDGIPTGVNYRTGTVTICRRHLFDEPPADLWERIGEAA